VCRCSQCNDARFGLLSQNIPRATVRVSGLFDLMMSIHFQAAPLFQRLILSLRSSGGLYAVFVGLPWCHCDFRA